MRRFLLGRRGQTLASAVVGVVLLVVVAGALTDGLNLLSTKQRCLQVATAAALRGSSRGRDFGGFVGTGQMRLDVATARVEAETAVSAGLVSVGLGSYTAQVEVLPDPGGGSVGNFPPGQTWSASEPSVGVYLVVPLDTVLMGWIDGGGPVDVHVFAAAGVVER